MPHPTQDPPPPLPTLVAGCLAILAGSATGLWAPAPLAVIAGAVAILRICWIDDNIRQDLEPAERMPAGYARTLRRRRHLSARLLGAAPREITCPRLLASHLRVQGHAIFAFLFGLAAAGLAAGAGDSAPGLIAAGAALILGFGRVDRLAAADAHLRRGAALPDHMLDDRGRLSRLVMNVPRTARSHGAGAERGVPRRGARGGRRDGRHR